MHGAMNHYRNEVRKYGEVKEHAGESAAAALLVGMREILSFFANDEEQRELYNIMPDKGSF